MSLLCTGGWWRDDEDRALNRFVRLHNHPEGFMNLAGKVAMVTGAAAGIGRASALALAKAGADVALNDLSFSAAEQLTTEVKALGRRVLLLPADVSDQTAVEAMVARVADELGRLDILVTSAVFSDREPFHAAKMTGFRRTIDVTMWGAFYAVRAAANQMIQQGRGGNVVVIGSPHAHVAVPLSMAYNMAKAATDQMARTAALELVSHRIRVNIVHPGWVDTAGERKFFNEEAIRQGAKSLPLGRMARPEEIARGVLFLVDPESDYITGSTLSIDGGSQLPWWSKRGSGEF
ncbi:MAG: SDR family oxidoreductase [Gemmataceae bacterium]|nr:SDR family oxidoreductase [Gemmataceae bacterium]